MIVHFYKFCESQHTRLIARMKITLYKPCYVGHICFPQETRHINLTMYGTPNEFTAMAQAVGKPAAIVAKMILNGKRVPPTGLLKPPRFGPSFVHNVFFCYSSS